MSNFDEAPKNYDAELSAIRKTLERPGLKSMQRKLLTQAIARVEREKLADERYCEREMVREDSHSPVGDWNGMRE
jgi:hypothetical protein